jgi:hypothetical protein
MPSALSDKKQAHASLWSELAVTRSAVRRALATVELVPRLAVQIDYLTWLVAWRHISINCLKRHIWVQKLSSALFRWFGVPERGRRTWQRKVRCRSVSPVF